MSSTQVLSNQCTRLFVGGVVNPLTVSSITRYFLRFGEIESCEIMVDPVTEVYKGFGFVTFSRPENARAALTSGDDHVVDGIRIEIKPTYSRQETLLREQTQANRKVYVDNIPLFVEKTELLEFFSTFGKIEEIALMYKGKGKDHAFAFVVFENAEVANLLIDEKLNFAGSVIHIRQAFTKEEMEERNKQKLKSKNSSDLKNSKIKNQSVISNLKSKQSKAPHTFDSLDGHKSAPKKRHDKHKNKSENAITEKNYTFTDSSSNYKHQKNSESKYQYEHQEEMNYRFQYSSHMMPYQAQHQDNYSDWELNQSYHGEHLTYKQPYKPNDPNEYYSKNSTNKFLNYFEYGPNIGPNSAIASPIGEYNLRPEMVNPRGRQEEDYSAYSGKQLSKNKYEAPNQHCYEDPYYYHPENPVKQSFFKNKTPKRS